MTALVTGFVYSALPGCALLDLAGGGWGAKATAVFLFTPVVGTWRLVLLFSGRRDGPRRSWERVAVVVASAMAAVCLAWGVVALGFTLVLLVGGPGLDRGRERCRVSRGPLEKGV